MHSYKIVLSSYFFFYLSFVLPFACFVRSTHTFLAPLRWFWFQYKWPYYMWLLCRWIFSKILFSNSFAVLFLNFKRSLCLWIIYFLLFFANKIKNLGRFLHQKQTNQGWSDAIDVHVLLFKLIHKAIGILIKNTDWQCRHDGYEFLRYNKASKNKWEKQTNKHIDRCSSLSLLRLQSSQQRSTMKGRKITTDERNIWIVNRNRNKFGGIEFFSLCWRLWIITRLFNVCQIATIK